MELQVFQNPSFGAVRVLTDEKGEPWFVAKDVCEVLGYSNTRDAIAKHVDKEDKQVLTSRNATLENIPNRGLVVINESGVYSLILRSKKPEAKKFKRWVTSEVLPAIRKHGGYLTPEKIEEILSNPDTIIKLATELKKAKEEKARLESKLIEVKPKVEFAEQVAEADNAILMRDFAKILSKKGVVIGEKKLFKWLRENGYLMKDNMPYQHYVDMGIFCVVETVKEHSYGTKAYRTTRVTGKGQVYLFKKLKEKGGF